MSERLAAVDIGTNSVLLLIAEDVGSELRALAQRCEISRLGAGVDRQRRLDARAIERTLAVLADYRELIERWGATRIGAVATAVLRDAENGADFIGPAARLLGGPVEIVSGRREAQLVVSGVSGTLGGASQRVLIFDVGGGSTELIAVQRGKIVDLVSLPLGAVRLTERHLAHDPPHASEIAAVRQAATMALQRLPTTFDGAFGEVIGVAGTVTTLATIELALGEYDSERVNGLSIDRKVLGVQLERLAALELARRRQIVGLDPARADVIIAGILVVGAIVERFGVERLRVCDRGVRWGLAHELHRAER